MQAVKWFYIFTVLRAVCCKLTPTAKFRAAHAGANAAPRQLTVGVKCNAVLQVTVGPKCSS